MRPDAGTAWTLSRRALTTLRIFKSLMPRHSRRQGLPVPTLVTVFEVVNGGKVYTVEGAALQRWIVQRRQEWKGPKGLWFSRRPTLS